MCLAVQEQDSIKEALGMDEEIPNDSGQQACTLT